MTFYEFIACSYGQDARRLMRDYHNILKKISRNKISTQFLLNCRRSKVTPNYISYKTRKITQFLQNQNSQSHQIIKHTNRKLLNLAINEKYHSLNVLEHKIKQIADDINEIIPNRTARSFFNAQRRSQTIFKNIIRKNTNRKFEQILKQEDLDLHVDKQWFKNLSSTPIPADVQQILALGPKFAVNHTKSDYPTYETIAEIENVIYNLDENISPEQIVELRTKMVSMLSSHLNKIETTVTPQQVYTQKLFSKTKTFLSNNKNIIIIEADKGNTTIAIDKQEYISKIQTILKDTNKYRILAKDPTPRLQTKNNEIVKTIHQNSTIDDITKKKLTTYTSTAPRCYAVMKLHKPEKPLRIIISNTGNPTYNLGKFINQICKSIEPEINYNIKNSYDLIEKLNQTTITNEEVIVSFDVVSMYERIPPVLVYQSIEKRWHLINKKTTIDKTAFINLIKFCIEENSYFQFNNKFYSQRTGLAIGGCASTILADFVLTDILAEAMSELGYDPVLIVKYVDDILMIIPKEEFQNTFTIFNSINKAIQFTYEIEENHRIPYLDIMIIRNNNTLSTEFYQKPTNQGRILNYRSNHPTHQKENTAYGLIHRILTLTSKQYWKTNIERAKSLLLKNNYPPKLISTQIKKYMRSRNKPKTSDERPTSKYIGCNYNNFFSEKMQKLVSKYDNKMKLAYKSKKHLKSIQNNVKDKIKTTHRKNIIYQINCQDCEKIYIGQTGQLLSNRMTQHKSDHKNKHIITETSTAAVLHSRDTGHRFNFEKPKILQMEHNYKKRTILEMVHIKNSANTVNKKSDTQKLHSIYATLLKKPASDHTPTANTSTTMDE